MCSFLEIQSSLMWAWTNCPARCCVFFYILVITSLWGLNLQPSPPHCFYKGWGAIWTRAYWLICHVYVNGCYEKEVLRSNSEVGTNCPNIQKVIYIQASSFTRFRHYHTLIIAEKVGQDSFSYSTDRAEAISVFWK